MNSGRRYCQRLLGGAILSLAAAILGGCDITQPSEDPWSDPSTFSWQGDTLRYHRWSSNLDGVTIDTVEFVARDSIAGNGDPIRILEKRGSRFPILTRTQKDTFMVFGDDSPVFQLVRPLITSHSWYAQFGPEQPGDTTMVPAWEAHIKLRYARKTIGGKEYEHVLEVQYDPLLERDIKKSDVWVRYFAKGIGPVLTRRFLDLNPDDGVKNPQPVEELTLLPD